MEWRRHRFIKVVYALRGTGTLYVGDHQHAFRAKDVLVVSPGTRNRIVDSPDQPSSLYVLCLQPSLLSFDRSIRDFLPVGRIGCSDYQAQRIEALLRRLLFQQSHGGHHASLAMAAAALHLLGILGETSPEPESLGPPPRGTEEMSRYVEYLDSHFFEARDIDSEARRMGVSRRTFTKRFRQATGLSWLAYVRKKAVDHAARLLVETSVPITSVAFECGFSDLSTFYRRFKAQLGVTPADWRNGNQPTPTVHPSFDGIAKPNQR